MKDLVKIDRLRVEAAKDGKREVLVADASFTIARHEVIVLLGESGSGKTVLSRSLTRLVSPGAGLHLEGSVLFRGRSVFKMSPEELMLLRRRDVRYIFQDPVRALNPVSTVRSQLLLAAGERSLDGTALPEMLEHAGISDARRVLELYPHQLSMGQAQRVVIAMALIPSPALLIADEPTSAVDVHLRFQILDLLMREHRTGNMSLMLITHDLETAQLQEGRVLVMFRGRIVESAPAVEFFGMPLHPYSQMLLDAHISGSGGAATATGAASIEWPPATGCRFSHRCPKVRDLCKRAEPELDPGPKGRTVRCHFWK